MQPGYLYERPVAFRPTFTGGLAVANNLIKKQKNSCNPQYKNTNKFELLL